MRALVKTLLVICVLAAGSGLYWWQTQANTKSADAGSGKTAKADGKAEGKGKGKGSGRRGGAGGPISVRVVEVARQNMPVVIDVVGTVESEHTVAVRPQVVGVVEAVMFKEGDFVKEGQALFRVDPRPAQATVDQVRATVARDQAQLVQARAQEARLRPLMEKDYITRSEFDVAATQVKALEATAEASRASLEQAQVQLSYSLIKAPISGRTGGLAIKAGNLVTTGNGAPTLVIINRTQPILVSLGVPQRYLEEIRRYWNTPELKVQISPNPAAPVVAEGTLVFMDNTVNPTTVTITLKARVKNDKEELWPGQFVAARIVLKIEKDAVVLPESAVQPGQNGPFVYVVRDGKAAMQEVQVSRQIGNMVVIAKGLNGGEQAVTDAPPSLADNSPVVLRGAGAPEGGGQAGEAKGKGKGKGKPEEAGKEATETQVK